MKRYLAIQTRDILIWLIFLDSGVYPAQVWCVQPCAALCGVCSLLCVIFTRFEYQVILAS